MCTLSESSPLPFRDSSSHFSDAQRAVISAVIVALGFQSLTRSAPLPDDHIPKDLSYVAAATTPFGANLHSQVLHCPTTSLAKSGTSASNRYVRWILNDGLLPLDHINGCATNEDGLCSLEAYTTWLRNDLQSIDWEQDCCKYRFPCPASLRSFALTSLLWHAQMAITPNLVTRSRTVDRHECCRDRLYR